MPERTRKSPFFGQGLLFSCMRCSACCRYESGFVFLSEKDASALGEALNMNFGDFIQSYCRWVSAGNGMEQLSLREKSNFDCIFWKEGCSVYRARPLQCRAFPFWKSVVNSAADWKNMASDCPGMNKGSLHTRESIEKWLVQRQKEPIIERIPIQGA